MKIKTYEPGSGKEAEVEIEEFDSWNCDHTIAIIAAPLLKQLKETNHGYGLVDDEDVPEELRSHNAAPVEDWETDDNAEARWDYVMDEIIWAMDYIANEVFNEDTYVQDETRCSEGCRLFGKYFRSLWD